MQLFVNPTVSTQANCLYRNFSLKSGNERIVLLREGDVERPLFLVHELSGDVHHYMPLAHCLDARIPVYGILAGDWVKNAEYGILLREVARQYVEIIKGIQSVGPYRLGGWSSAGIIAYEIASLLKEEGDDVEFVGLIDTYVPERSGQEEGCLFTARSELIDYIKNNGKSLDESAIRDMEKTSCIDDLISKAQLSGALPSDISREELKRRAEVSAAVMTVTSGYELRDLLECAYLFTPRMEGAGVAFHAWRRAGLDVSHCIETGGSHMSIVNPPFVEVLAEQMSNILLSHRNIRELGV